MKELFFGLFWIAAYYLSRSRDRDSWIDPWWMFLAGAFVANGIEDIVHKYDRGATLMSWGDFSFMGFAVVVLTLAIFFRDKLYKRVNDIR